MQSLFLGLTAALLWGLHDFSVRKIGPQADAAALYLVVLAAGAVLLAPIAAFNGGWASLTLPVTGLTLCAGLAMATAGFGPRQAFAIV